MNEADELRICDCLWRGERSVIPSLRSAGSLTQQAVVQLVRGPWPVDDMVQVLSFQTISLKLLAMSCCVIDQKWDCAFSIGSLLTQSDVAVHRPEYSGLLSIALAVGDAAAVSTLIRLQLFDPDNVTLPVLVARCITRLKKGSPDQLLQLSAELRNRGMIFL
jgi:hypothetical protein